MGGFQLGGGGLGSSRRTGVRRRSTHPLTSAREVEAVTGRGGVSGCPFIVNMLGCGHHVLELVTRRSLLVWRRFGGSGPKSRVGAIPDSSALQGQRMHMNGQTCVVSLCRTACRVPSNSDKLTSCCSLLPNPSMGTLPWRYRSDQVHLAGSLWKLASSLNNTAAVNLTSIVCVTYGYVRVVDPHSGSQRVCDA